MFSYDWQSIHLESSNRLSINSRHGKAIPKGDDKWEKGANIYMHCIGTSKDMASGTHVGS